MAAETAKLPGQKRPAHREKTVKSRLAELEQRNAELIQKAAEMEARLADFQAQFVAAPVAWFLLDWQARIIRSNLASSRLFGEPAQALENQSFTHYLVEESQPDFHHFWEGMQASRMPGKLRITLQTKNGLKHRLQLDAAPLPDRSACQVVLADFPAVPMGEEHYLELVEVLPYGVQEIDADGNILYANRALHEMFGYTPDEMVGMNFCLLPADELERSALSRYLAWLVREQPATQPYTIVSRRKDGSLFSVKADWGYRRDPFDHVTGFVIIITNISGLLASQRASERANQRLETLLALGQLQVKNHLELLDKGLEAAIHLSGSAVGYIFTCDEKKQTILLSSWPGRAQASVPPSEASLTIALEHSGVWGEAVHRRSEWIVNTPTASFHLAESILSVWQGVKRCIIVPIVRGNTVVALVGLANKAADYDEEDARQLHLFADLLWDLGERQYAVDSLTRSEATTRALLGATQEAAYLISIDGVYLAGNAPTWERLNIHEKDLIGKNAKDIVPADIYNRRLKFYAEVADLGKPVQFFDKFGDREVDHTVFPVRDEETGEVWALASFSRDVTQQNRAEARVREQAMFSEFSPGPVIRVDSQGVVLSVNPAAGALGMQSGNLVRDTLTNLDGIDWSACVSGGLNLTIECALGEEIFEFVVQGLPEYQWAHLYGSRITLRKRAEQGLAASEARWRAIFDLAGVAIAILDMQGHWLQANRQYEQLLGYPVAELRRMTNLDVTHPADRKRTRMYMIQAPTDRFEKHRVEERYIRKDGSAVWVDLSMTTYFDGKGTPAGMISAAIDITARKELEIEHEKSLEFLGLVNSAEDREQLVAPLIGLLQSWSGCEAVGIRLQDHDDFPFYQTLGFPPEFLEEENSVCLRDSAGQNSPRQSGRGVLSGICDGVLSGYFSTDLPFMTPNGSFWANSASVLLTCSNGAVADVGECDRCRRAGFESVALIPLRAGGKTYGLLHFVDRNAGRFTLKTVEAFERVATQLSLALARWKAVDDLADEDARLKALIDNVDGMVWAVNLKYRLIAANASFRHYVLNQAGIKIADGEDALRLYGDSETVLEEWQEYLNQAFAGGHLLLRRYHHPEHPEQGIDEISFRPIFDAESQVVGATIYLRDVTKQQQMENALRDSEIRYRRLVENIEDLVCEVDENGRFTYLSPQYERMLGYTPTELVGRRMSELGHPEERPSFEQRFQRLSGQERKSRDIWRFQNKKGEWIWFECSGTQFETSPGVTRAVVISRDITLQKTIQEELQRSEEHYYSLFENAAIAVWEEDFSEVKKLFVQMANEGVKDFRQYFNIHPEILVRCAAMIRVVNINEKSVRLLGARTKDEVIRRLSEYFTEESYPVFAEELIQLAEGKTSFSSEIATRVPEGQRQVLDLNLQVARGYEDTLSSVLVSFSDITARKVAESQIRSSEERFRAIADYTLDWDNWVSPEGRLIWTNPFMERVTGYSPQEFLQNGHFPFFIIAPEDRELLASIWADALAGKAGSNKHFRFIRKDGQLRWGSVSWQTIYNEAGKSLGHRSTIRDITDYKRAEEQIRFQAHLLDVVQQMVIATDLYGKILYWNRFAEIHSGWVNADVVGRDVAAFIPALHTGALPLDSAAELRAGRSISNEISTIRKDGSVFPAQVTVTPMLEENGVRAGFVSVIEDITERVRAGDQLNRRFEMEQNVAAITSYLVEESDFPQAIQFVLAQLGQSTQAGAVFICAFDSFGPTECVLYTAHPQGLAVRRFENDRSRPESAGGDSVYQNGGTVDIEYIYEDQDAQVKLTHFLAENGVRTISCFPWKDEDENTGVLGLADLPEAAGLPDENRDGLVTIAQVIGSAFKRWTILLTLEQRVNDRTRELRALYLITAFAAQNHGLDEILTYCLKIAVETLNQNGGSIYVVNNDTQLLQLAASHHMPADHQELPDLLPFDHGMPGWVAAHDQSLMVPDISQDDRAAGSSKVSLFNSYLGVPMHVDGRMGGVINVYGNTPQSLTAEDVTLLTTISDQIALVYENMLLRQQAEQAVIIQERQRLARDLHDSVTQSLYSLMLLAAASSKAIQSGGIDRSRIYLEKVEANAQQALKEMRLLIYELHPIALEQKGLVGALQQRIDAVEKRSGMEVRLLAAKEFQLSPVQERELYGMAQEALNNSLKHSGGQQIEIHLQVVEIPDSTSRQYVMEINDNGQGFDPENLPQGGLGLTSLRERAARVGAELQIESSQNGTRIRVIIVK
jgi:PAS domain S-box-containing protein